MFVLNCLQKKVRHEQEIDMAKSSYTAHFHHETAGLLSNVQGNAPTHLKLYAILSI